LLRGRKPMYRLWWYRLRQFSWRRLSTDSHVKNTNETVQSINDYTTLCSVASCHRQCGDAATRQTHSLEVRTKHNTSRRQTTIKTLQQRTSVYKLRLAAQWEIFAPKKLQVLCDVGTSPSRCTCGIHHQELSNTVECVLCFVTHRWHNPGRQVAYWRRVELSFCQTHTVRQTAQTVWSTTRNMADNSYELSPPAYDDDTSVNGATASPEAFSHTGQKHKVSTSFSIVEDCSVSKHEIIDSGVTKVGVTRCGNWRCHLFFSLKNWRPF